MKLKSLIIVNIFLLLAATATATIYEGRCTIKFFGQSTLHGFDGQATCQPFSLISEEKTRATAEEVGKAGIIRQPTIKVLVSEMDTDNSGRDKKMFAMFDQEKYPEIKGLFADLDPDVILLQLQATEATSGNLGFDLSIREISQRVQATTSNLVVTPEQISFVMKFTLSLSSFQLEAPSVLGLIRVDDQVRVEVIVFLQRQ